MDTEVKRTIPSFPEIYFVLVGGDRPEPTGHYISDYAGYLNKLRTGREIRKDQNIISELQVKRKIQHQE